MLLTATEKVSAGESIDIKDINIKSQDEIGQLGQAFIEMAGNLQDSQNKQQQAHNELAKTEARVTSIFNNSVSSIITFDEEGTIDSYNTASTLLFGYDPEEIIGRNIGILLPIILELGVKNYLSTLTSLATTQGISSGEEVVGQRKDGNSVPVFFSIGEMTIEGKTYYIGNLQDISDQKHTQELIQKQNESLQIEKEKAEMATRAKDSFLATMSHEIRTPMNGVLGMTQILMDTELSAEQRNYLQTINTSGNSLLGIINDILDFSKIEAGKMDIEPIPFDLNVAVMDTCELYASKCQEKGLELIVNYPPDLPRNFVGDPGRIRQIITNLIGNAIKFTEEGHVLLEIKSLKQYESEVQLGFSIVDSGIGISQEAQENLFSAFTQADTSTTRKYGGTGLGLTICKQLVELMGGNIGVKSEANIGTTFYFDLTLPLSEESKLEIPANFDFGQLHALIVDDNEINLKILSNQLSAWGIRAETASSAEIAIKKLKYAIIDQDPYQIVLSDYHMPDKSGEDLVKAVKQDADIKDSQFILLSSSSGNRGDAARLFKLGFMAYLDKPINLNILHKVIGLVWEHSQQGTVPKRLITRHTISEAEQPEADHTVIEQPDTDTLVTKQTGPSESTTNTEQNPAVHEFNNKMLLVEDNIVNQMVGQKMLETLGCTVSVAANGLECIDMYNQFSYDIIFMDCQMPVMDGFEATKKIREMEANSSQHQIIIAMTANAVEGDREHCIQQGMDDYVSKPVDKDKLQAMLSKWVNKTKKHAS